MSKIINDYNRFYRGMESLRNYVSNSALKRDTLVRYEFNTTDEHGNKIMDKMSKEEMFKAMKDIRSQYGDNVIVQFSGDGMAALIESKKGAAKGNLSDEEAAVKYAAFQNEIVQNQRETLNHMPAYSGMFEDDKTIAAALENFISEDKREAFLDAMENIAKLASAGKADNNGNMDYGVNKVKYLGHGSNIVYTTNTDDMMKQMDSAAYEEYKKLSGKDSLKYLMNWYEDVLKRNPDMVNEYEQRSEKYVEENVKNQKLDTTFKDIKTDSKTAFLESLRAFQLNNPGFLSSLINRELSLQFWSR